MKFSNKLFLLLLLSLNSCQLFETEKISTETFYKEELNSIDWNDVDQYPVFKACEERTEKEVQRQCFVNSLSETLYNTVQKNIYGTYQSISSTVLVELSVSERARFSIDTIRMDSLLLHTFPRLKSALYKSVDSLQLIAPAYKRGIPVRTQFTLPIRIETREL